MKLIDSTDLDSNNLHIWQQVQTKLKNEYGEGTYKSWSSKLAFVSSDTNKLILLAPTKFMREWIVTHYLESIKKSWRSFNPELRELEINIANSSIKSTSNDSSSKKESANNNDNIVDIDSFYKTYNLASVLDSRFIFD